MLFDTVCFIVYVVLAVILIYILVRVILWLFDVLYHVSHPGIPKLRSRRLKGYLKEKYGKREGKKLFKDFKYQLWKRFKIR